VVTGWIINRRITQEIKRNADKYTSCCGAVIEDKQNCGRVMSVQYVYTVSGKGAILFLVITLLYTNQFSKF